MKYQLSIIIPTYNEEENIAEVIIRIPKLPYSTEIIVVDDGKDKTAEIASRTKNSHYPVLVLHFNEKKGKGGAFLEGLKKSQGEVVVILDSDLAIIPEEIGNVVSPIFNGNADFVNASRFRYKMASGAMTHLHYVGNRIYAFLSSVFLHIRLTDVFCGYKAFKKNLLQDYLSEKGWPDLDLIFSAKRRNLKIVEVPVHYYPRKRGKSKMRAFKHGWELGKNLLRNVKKLYFF